MSFFLLFLLASLLEDLLFRADLLLMLSAVLDETVGLTFRTMSFLGLMMFAALLKSAFSIGVEPSLAASTFVNEILEVFYASTFSSAIKF